MDLPQHCFTLMCHNMGSYKILSSEIKGLYYWRPFLVLACPHCMKLLFFTLWSHSTLSSQCFMELGQVFNRCPFLHDFVNATSAFSPDGRHARAHRDTRSTAIQFCWNFAFSCYEGIMHFKKKWKLSLSGRSVQYNEQSFFFFLFFIHNSQP